MRGAVVNWLWGRYSALGAWIALATVVIDQAHKGWMLLVYRIQDRGRVALTPFLDLVFVRNQGVSYGMLAHDDPRAQWLLAALAVVASVGLAIWLARGASNRLMAAGIGLVIGGAIGNAIDRVLIGGVADFFSLHAFGFYWYVFNIADIAIVAGVVGLLLESFMSQRRPASKSS